MTLSIKVELTIRPGNRQTQEDAEAEFVSLFRDYLANKEGTFQADYGPDAWGGYEGPTVTHVSVLCAQKSAEAPEVAIGDRAEDRSDHQHRE